MAAVVTDPASPLTLVGSATTAAPRRAAASRAAAGSATVQATWRTPSPWRWTWRTTSESGLRPGGHHEADVTLPEQVRDPVADSGLRAGVGGHVEPESGGEPGGDGPGVAHPPLEVVPSRDEVGNRRGGDAERGVCHASTATPNPRSKQPIPECLSTTAQYQRPYADCYVTQRTSLDGIDRSNHRCAERRSPRQRAGVGPRRGRGPQHRPEPPRSSHRAPA